VPHRSRKMIATFWLLAFLPGSIVLVSADVGGKDGGGISAQESKPQENRGSSKPALRLHLDVGLGLGYHKPFAKGVTDVPAEIRYVPYIPTPPHLIETDDIATQSSLTMDFRLAPRLTWKWFSLSGGFEYPLRLISLPILERMYFSLEDTDIFYEGREGEGLRTFVEVSVFPIESLKIGLGWMTSKYHYEFRSGTTKTFKVGSGMYWHIPEYGYSEDTYRKYTVAEEDFGRYYFLVGIGDPDSQISLNLNLFIERNPFAGHLYEYAGSPIKFLFNEDKRIGASVSLIISLF
jgi:hypothetical protein